LLCGGSGFFVDFKKILAHRPPLSANYSPSPSLQHCLSYSTHNNANTLCFPSKGDHRDCFMYRSYMGNDRFLHIPFIGFHYFLERSVDTAAVYHWTLLQPLTQDSDSCFTLPPTEGCLFLSKQHFLLFLYRTIYICMYSCHLKPRTTVDYMRQYVTSLSAYSFDHDYHFRAHSQSPQTLIA